MSKSELDKAKAKLKATITGLFLTMFLLGAVRQMPVQFIYAAGILSGIFLLRLAIARWYRR